MSTALMDAMLLLDGAANARERHSAEGAAEVVITVMLKLFRLLQTQVGVDALWRLVVLSGSCVIPSSSIWGSPSEIKLERWFRLGEGEAQASAAADIVLRAAFLTGSAVRVAACLSTIPPERLSALLCTTVTATSCAVLSCMVLVALRRLPPRSVEPALVSIPDLMPWTLAPRGCLGAELRLACGTREIRARLLAPLVDPAAATDTALPAWLVWVDAEEDRTLARAHLVECADASAALSAGREWVSEMVKERRRLFTAAAALKSSSESVSSGPSRATRAAVQLVQQLHAASEDRSVIDAVVRALFLNTDDGDGAFVWRPAHVSSGYARFIVNEDSEASVIASRALLPWSGGVPSSAISATLLLYARRLWPTDTTMDPAKRRETIATSATCALVSLVTAAAVVHSSSSVNHQARVHEKVLVRVHDCYDASAAGLAVGICCEGFTLGVPSTVAAPRILLALTLEGVLHQALSARPEHRDSLKVLRYTQAFNAFAVARAVEAAALMGRRHTVINSTRSRTRHDVTPLASLVSRGEHRHLSAMDEYCSTGGSWVPEELRTLIRQLGAVWSSTPQQKRPVIAEAIEAVEDPIESIPKHPRLEGPPPPRLLLQRHSKTLTSFNALNKGLILTAAAFDASGDRPSTSQSRILGSKGCDDVCTPR